MVEGLDGRLNMYDEGTEATHIASQHTFLSACAFFQRNPALHKKHHNDFIKRIEPVSASTLSLCTCFYPALLLSTQPATRNPIKPPRYPSTLKLGTTPRPDRPQKRGQSKDIFVRNMPLGRHFSETERESSSE